MKFLISFLLLSVVVIGVGCITSEAGQLRLDIDAEESVLRGNLTIISLIDYSTLLPDIKDEAILEKQIGLDYAKEASLHRVRAQFQSNTVKIKLYGDSLKNYKRANTHLKKVIDLTERN